MTPSSTRPFRWMLPPVLLAALLNVTLGTALDLPTLAAQSSATVSVDFASPLPNTPSLMGLLHGFGGVTPVNDNQVRQVKPRLFRGSLAQALIMEGTRTGKQALVAELGARYLLMMSDVWGYPVTKYECGSCPIAAHPSADWAKWETFVRDKAQRAKSNNYTNVLFEVWDEPDDAGYGLGSESEHHQTYLRAERAVHALLPNAPVVGPSFGTFDAERIRRFLDFCLANGCEVNALTWHELLDEPRNPDPNHLPPDIPDITTHLRYAREQFLANPKYAPLKIAEIIIDEHTGLADAYRPAESLGYLAAMELGGANAAARWCWDLYNPEQYECFNGSLGGILKANQPRAVWWIHRSYNMGVASRVTSTSSDPAVVVLASAEGYASAASQVVIGHQRLMRRNNPPPMPVAVELNGLDKAPHFAGAGGVAVTVLRVPDTGRGSYLQPEGLKQIEVPILAGRARVDAGSIPLHEAYILQLRRGTMAPITVTPAPPATATSTPTTVPPTPTPQEASPTPPSASATPTAGSRPTATPSGAIRVPAYLPFAVKSW